MKLPAHVIEKILKLNFRDRHEISLVCKSFYEAISKIYENSTWLKLDGDDIVSMLSRKI